MKLIDKYKLEEKGKLSPILWVNLLNLEHTLNQLIKSHNELMKIINKSI